MDKLREWRRECLRLGLEGDGAEEEDGSERGDSRVLLESELVRPWVCGEPPLESWGAVAEPGKGELLELRE